MEKVVGVIGGLGPKATLDFYSKVLDKTVANQDQDHLQVIINSNPKIPNRHTSIAGTGPSCIPSLIESARSLERAGADFLVMVCNTAHAYEDVIVSATSIPFISIISESVKACLAKKPGLSKVGLLAADGCLDADLYQEKF
ncbi:MAG: amino acid racemase, partial [Chloroflexota bacterium]